MPSSAGQWEFGPEAISGPRSWTDLTLGFFDKHLRGAADTWKGGAVRYFMMGENQWRSAASWPPKHQPWKLYLHSFGQANSSAGNGTLSVDEPANEPRDSFIYDPNDPVPSVGGRTLFYHPKLGMPGVFDQREVEKRDDVLVYTSERLSTPLKIAGPIAVRLFAVSSAVDTDFTAKLVDVDPAGYCANIAEGIIRGRYRSDPRREELLKPGETNEFEIDLWAAAHSFGVGHRIRLEISSSNFPRFSRNLNSAVNPSMGTADDITVASQQGLHDSKHASHIVLPVVPQ
jgi:putative CocE/NonD family hydrolase